MVNLQQLVREMTEYASDVENTIVKTHLQACANILHAADQFLNAPQQDKLETFLGYQLESVVEDKDVNLLHQLGFKAQKKASVVNKKVLYLCDNLKVLFARNQYKEQYPNDGPIIGKSQDEIDLVNECDYIVVARYQMGSDKDAPYVDGVAFDIRKVKLVIKNDVIDFMPLEPMPNNASIFAPQNTTDWVKLNNLPSYQ